MKARDVIVVLSVTAGASALIWVASPERPAVPSALSASSPRAEADGAGGAFPPARASLAPEPFVSGRFGEWRWIVVHHTGEDSGDLASLDERHRLDLGYEDGLAFHFLVGNGNGLALGAVAESDRWRRGIPGPHCTENPAISLAAVGVAAVGDTGARSLEPASFSRLVDLVLSLMTTLRIPPERVLLHREVEGGQADCPGARFDSEAFHGALAARHRDPMERGR